MFAFQSKFLLYSTFSQVQVWYYTSPHLNPTFFQIFFHMNPSTSCAITSPLACVEICLLSRNRAMPAIVFDNNFIVRALA